MTAPGRFPDPLLAAEQQDGVVFLLRVDGAGGDFDGAPRD